MVRPRRGLLAGVLSVNGVAASRPLFVCDEHHPLCETDSSLFPGVATSLQPAEAEQWRASITAFFTRSARRLNRLTQARIHLASRDA